MKILFFSYAYPNLCNPGLATFNRTMIAGLATEHEVRVVSSVPFVDAWSAWAKGRLPKGLNSPDFQAVPNVRAAYCTWYYTPKFLRDQYGRFMSLSVRSLLNRVLSEFQPDLVLSYWTHPDGEVAVKAAHRFGIRAVTMVGGSDVLLNARTGSRRDAVLSVLKAADHVITVSDDIKRVLIADGIAARKLSVVRRGIDRERFSPGDRNVARTKLGLPDDRSILISVGRLVGVKGHAHLIEALRLLAVRGLPFRCYLLGDGPLKVTLQHQIDQSGLTDMVELRGPQSPAQLSNWYRAADLSVLASLSEGVPNVLLESIACGTPFVASDVGGIPEIADPTIDRLVPASDPAALADAIATQLTKGNLMATTPRSFTPPTIAESTSNLSSILESVRTGVAPTKVVSTPIPPAIQVHSIHAELLHETMTDRDVDSGRTEIRTAKQDKLSDTARKFDVRKLVQPVLPDEDDDDVCGRTGEGFRFTP